MQNNKNHQGFFNKRALLKTLGWVIIFFGLYQAYIEFYNHEWRYVTPSDEQVDKYAIRGEVSLNLYQILKDVHEVLTKHNVQYWIEGGTLLGAVRHKGIIPFDDDLDIGIMQSDEMQFQKIFPEFQRLGYKIRYNGHYTIFDKVGLDIFVFQQQDKKYVHADLKIRREFPDDFFYIDELLPLKKYKFGEIEVFGPKEFKSNLNRLYPGWDEYAVIQQPHNFHVRLNGIEQKTKFLLTPKLLQPAMPIGPLQNRVNTQNKSLD